MNTKRLNHEQSKQNLKSFFYMLPVTQYIQNKNAIHEERERFALAEWDYAIAIENRTTIIEDGVD